jgi:hypothetical protein
MAIKIQLLVHNFFCSLFSRLADVLKQRTEDVDVKRYCLDYMRKMGSLEYTRYGSCVPRARCTFWRLRGSLSLPNAF